MFKNLKKSETTSVLPPHPPAQTLTSTLLLIHCARGSHWKTSLNSWNIWAVYLALTSPSKPYIWFMLSVSWFPAHVRASLLLVQH